MEHEGAECCQTIQTRSWHQVVLIHCLTKHYVNGKYGMSPSDLISQLMNHCKTQTHVIRKWRVGRKKLLKEFERLKVILGLRV